MKRNFGARLLLLAALLLAGWMVARPAFDEKKAVSDPAASMDERINLAIRYAAHRLLVASGNTSSRIPPVHQTGENRWSLRFEPSFNYDSLPGALSEAFERHGIGFEYDASLRDCSSDEIVLGFSTVAVVSGEQVACGGRKQEGSCVTLTIQFHTPSSESTPNPYLYAVLSLLTLSGLVLGGSRYLNRKKHSSLQEPEAGISASIQLGSTVMFPGSQKVAVNGKNQTLSYRESKLLELFFQNPGVLLERQQILQSVWGTEGVLVGRSIDVFVSRLRKILKEDPDLKISAVHGLGYKLEIGIRDEV